mgnify:FL=1
MKERIARGRTNPQCFSMDDVHFLVPPDSILSRLSRAIEGVRDVDYLLHSLHSSFPDKADLKNALFKLEVYAQEVMSALFVCSILVME